MKLLINKTNNGADEIRDLTGAYYENNDFSKIQTDWLLAQEEVQKLVGKAIITRALEHYLSNDYLKEDGSGSGYVADDELVQHLQVPIAYLATIRFYESNLVSHEDSGRKVKIDNTNEKMAWEWMLDRDDAAHQRKSNETLDRLINFLDEKQFTEWLSSPNRALTRKLLINTAALFHQAYPIDNSTRFFYTITPFIDEVQRRTIRKALGAHFAALLAYWKNFNSTQGSGSGSIASGLPGDYTDEFLEELLHLVQTVMPLLVMVMAVKRLSLQALPEGVVQTFRSMIQARNASQPALPEVIEKYCKMLNEDATYALDDIKRLLNANDPEALAYPLLPKNDAKNKYFRT